jgi:hypothetical protein
MKGNRSNRGESDGAIDTVQENSQGATDLNGFDVDKFHIPKTESG